MARSKYLQSVGSIRDQMQRSFNRTPSLGSRQTARLNKTYGQGNYSLSPQKGYTQAGRVSTPQTSRFGRGSAPVYTRQAQPQAQAAAQQQRNALAAGFGYGGGGPALPIPGAVRETAGQEADAANFAALLNAYQNDLGSNPTVYTELPQPGFSPAAAAAAGGGGGVEAGAGTDPGFDFDAFFATMEERDRQYQEAAAKMQADMMAMFEGAMAQQQTMMQEMEAKRLAAEEKRAAEFKVAQENLERGGRTADFKIGGSEGLRARKYGTTGFKRRKTAARTVAKGIAPISEKETV